MANKFEKPPFKHLDGTYNISPTPYRMAEGEPRSRVGLRDGVEAEMDEMFPGTRQVLPDNERLFELYGKYSGYNGISPDSDAAKGMAYHGITGYEGWTHFSMTPNLASEWEPNPDDPSQIDTPFMPNASSPTPDEHGRLQGNREDGWRRPDAPANYGKSVEESRAGVYNAEFISDSEEAREKTAERVKRTLGAAMRQADSGN